MKCAFFFLFIFTFYIHLIATQITVLPARNAPPPDLSISNTTYGTPLNATNNPSDDDCAIIHSIQRTEDGLNYKIVIDLNLNGRGCKKVIPWTVGPSEDGMTVYGRDALTSCNTNSPFKSCRQVNSGPAGGISLSFDPPIYGFPLTVPQNSPVVPFGYAGYFSYELNSQGACANYGYANRKTQMITTVNGISHAGIAFAFPNQNQCSHLPTQNAFVSMYSGKQAAERVFAFTNYLALPSNDAFNMSGNAMMSQLPYGYANTTRLLGIIEPFLCNPNSSNHYVGNTRDNVHSCPMTANEWESILPDVVSSSTADVFFGPNTTSYGEYQRDGQWIVPLVNTNTLPVNCYICSHMRDAKGSLAAAGANYASSHMPINLAYGPGCTALRAYQSHINAIVSVGGYVGISKTSDPFSGVWSTSAGFPVRNMKQLGNTVKISDVLGQGYSSDAQMEAMFTTTGGTNGKALKVDMDALRYVLCNSLTGSVTASGYNSTSGLYLGPLVSTLRTHNDNTPIWPNPFRWTSPVGNNSNCFGCTYPTIQSQKGWTVFDSRIWEASQGKECGKYQSDHSLWARFLSMVNFTEIEATNLRFFSKWNDTSNRPDYYLENAQGLNLNIDTEYYPKIANEFIPGLGPGAWASLIGNLDKHSCRPAPQPNFYANNAGQQAIPLCTLLRRQLYYQTYALNDTLRERLGIPTSTPDLNSASRTGIYNLLAPNIWFGIFQKSIFDGNSQWMMFMDDTFDRTGNSIFEADGVAKNVTGRIEMLIPTSSVDVPYAKRSNGIQNFNYRVDMPSCIVFNQFANPSLANYAYVSAIIVFGAPSGFVNDVVSTFTPIFSGQNSQTRFNYVTENMIVELKYPSGSVVNITNYNTEVIGNAIQVTLPYMTVSIVYEYRITIPVVIGSITNNQLPIIHVESFYQNIASGNVIQNVTLQNTNTNDNFGCDFNAVETPLSITLHDYTCSMAGEEPAIETCYSTFDYEESGSQTLFDDCDSSDGCPRSNTFLIDSCGFGLGLNDQSFQSGVHFYYDGSSINYNLNGIVSRLTIASEYTISNCGIDSLFFPLTFGVQVCGSVSNAVTGYTQSIACDGAYLPFDRVYDIFNDTGYVYKSAITWQTGYNTVFVITFIGPIAIVEVIQDENWFVSDMNQDICTQKGTTNVFCNYDPLNTIFNVNLNLHLPFNCSDYVQNLFYSQDMEITSKMVASVKLTSTQSTFNYIISNYAPNTYICTRNDTIFDPTTTTASTITHTISTVPSDQTISVPFDFQHAFDESIKSIVPPCVVDFSNVAAPPGLLPLGSYCYPFVNSESYYITPNCTIIDNGNAVPETRLKNSQVYRNMYGVYNNFTELLVWKCQLFPSKPNVTELLNCTVYGDTGKRVGNGCYYFEDILAQCSKWWNLSCGINNYYQFTFLFLIMIAIPALILFIIVIVSNFAENVALKHKTEEVEASFQVMCSLLEKMLYNIG
jgi:hypothetical protein